MNNVSSLKHGKLSFVATPIGNLEDITLRALKTLRECDAVVCEDTRVTSKLLTAHGISKPLFSLHEHTAPAVIKRVLAWLEQGQWIAYAADAGTPNVNDPGGKLAAAAYEAELKIETIPGPSALTAALAVCGFFMVDFWYRGFVPHKKGRKKYFSEIAANEQPTIFLESTHRINKTLDELSCVLEPERLIFLGREMTKMHETYYRGTVELVKASLQKTSAKGEFVLIVGPKNKL